VPSPRRTHRPSGQVRDPAHMRSSVTHTARPVLDLGRPAGAAVAVSAPVLVRPVLIVDDDPPARLLVRESLRVLGLTNPTIEAADGERAVEELHRCLARGPEFHPALMLLDRHMTGISGLDVLRWMRATPGFEALPVVMLTADDGLDGVTEAYGLGVSSYLIKPVGFGALAAVITGLELPWRLM
jgi:CheY-like chemotaxis protein